MIWEPSREWVEQTNVWRFMRRLGFDDRDTFLNWSSAHPETFWDEMLREMDIEWARPYERVLDESRGPEWARWFIGGKLNIARNCLERHRNSARPAIVAESEDGPVRTLSFGDVDREASRLANALDALGLRPGDRVALAMPMVPEAVSVLYACFKLGLIAVPIFAGFGASAIATRLQDSGARVVFTAGGIERRGKVVPLKAKVDEALAKCPSVERVVVLPYRGPEPPMQAGRDVSWRDFIAGQPGDRPSLPLDSEAPALLLYTSGTTGKPKGAVHTHAGALAQTAKEIYLGFDHKDADRFFWLSDIGWMMGPWTIIGNHAFGGTIFLYDGAPDFPAPDRLWQMIDRHGITTFGISPTAVRLLMKYGDELTGLHPMRALRLLGSTGEPWDEKSWLWFFEHAGRRRCPVINISGGTEIIGCFLFPLPLQPLEPCSVGGPAPGMATDIFDEQGRPVRGRVGYLVCTKPSPSMTRGVWGDPERYIEAYWSRFPGVWYHGDWASTDEHGQWFLHGRADEAMNVAGRKVGPAEVEEALMECPGVAEAAVIGVPDELKGEAIVAFVVMRPGAAFSEDALSQHLVNSLGPTFRPRQISAVPELPKTQSGKVVRRLIRRQVLGEPLDDVSTVANPGALTAFGIRQAP